MTERFCVRPGVYFAAVQGEGVLMDLVQDVYYGLGAESTAIWNALQNGLTPNEIADTAVGSSATARERVARQLDAWHDARLVTTRGDAGAALPALRPLKTPATTGLETARLDSARFSWMLLLHLLRARRWSRRALSKLGLGQTLRILQAIPVAPAHAHASSDTTLFRLMRVYHSARVWRSQGKDDCLPRSLMLMSALRRLGIDAEICFGVRKFPFSAHAWVEARHTVINDLPETIAKYTVIGRF